LWVREEPVQTQRIKQSGKHLVEHSQQIMNHFLISKFPEISTSKVVTWQAHVDDKTSSKEVAYDMIMGMDFVNTSGKAGAQIPHPPLGNDSSPWGR
jgi:hypothetical protein